MQAIVGKWDLYNVRLAIEAKSRKRPFESISKYLVNLGMHNASVIKEAMREESVEGMLSKLMINSPYKAMLSDAAEAYKKNRNSLESISALDKDYYLYLGSMAMALKNSKEGRETSYMLRMELDVRNILTMVRGKRASMKFGEIQGLLVGKGNISLASLEKMYSGSKDVDEMVSQLKSFDIMPAMERYRKDPHKQLITIEMGLRSSMLSKGMRMLGHKILSFGTILAYVYMKEYEISILRVLINGKAYGLDKEEAERLIGWKGK
jgi:vacuolar-type H+-ATPase subunit C/Vma6